MFRCLVLFSFVFLLSLNVNAESFLAGTEDVPLMSDFQISKDETFGMEAEDGVGRLFFSKAFTQFSPQKVLAFYRQTLPQLGWIENKDGYFEREGDILKIAVVSGEYEKRGLTSVVFELITK